MTQANAKVLITGGSGLVGSRLTEILLASGYRVNHLSTRKNAASRPDGVTVYHWNPAEGSMDLKALEGVDHVINLAGASISKRWTAEYKKEILNSRIDSLNTLFDGVKKSGQNLKSLISSSAVGYYPSRVGEEFIETDSPGNDFLGSVSQLWERGADRFSPLNVRVAILRTGIVLSEKGGALPVLAKTVRWFVGAPVGSGKQVLPWIHIDDLCKMYQHALEAELEGKYNAVGPSGASNKEFTKELGRVLKRPIWPFNVPSFVLKLVLGEQAQLVLISSPSSAKKIMDSGFDFKFKILNSALTDLLK